MFSNLLTKFFGTRTEREVKKLQPTVDKINDYYNQFESLTDDDLKVKTSEFKSRIQEGEELLSLLPEAFAVVKQACKRMVGKSWSIDGRMQKWEMIPYDVQLMGGIVLAEGKIAEMATGEGKTLVALFPCYLHGLTGKGVHVITVNDYLAKRDRDWMGTIHEFLGLSVGVVTSDLRDPELKKEQYKRDITYGINSSFGFDYLHDNMAYDVESMVQRGFNFCLIDEVDSVLIDEARIPLIISGVVEQKNSPRFVEYNKTVNNLVREQTRFVNNLVQKAENALEERKEREGFIYLLKAQKALPKHKRLAKILNKTGVKTGVQKIENEFLRDKKFSEITDDLYYIIEERSNTVDLMQKGHEILSANGEDKNMFILPDLSLLIHEIDKSDLSKSEKEAEKEKIQSEYSEKSDKIHTVHQLLKAYCLYEKDVEYVVKDQKVIIVDQSTGRLKPDSRFGDGIHQAIEAKEGVTVGRDTQTVAAVTYQNYFRMYKTLAGMTGTAITEEDEFFEIYKLPVVQIPTNKPITRKDYEDYIYTTKAEKYNAIIEEVIRLNKKGRPVLIGTPDVDISEVMHKLLIRRGVNHNLLNAKNHAKEASIVREAGKSGMITIATNMAGRGTDIKLGEGVKELGGLAIIGVERHNSRRIDRQLRGRAGRQGDPGSSRFYVSLEDNLMRLFGSERIAGIMDKFGHEQGEPIAHPWISKSIERAQKRVEANNFSMRKHVIEYDNVLNNERKVIYARRRAALIKGAISEGIEVPFAKEYGINPDESLDLEVYEMIEDFISEVVYRATSHTNVIEEWDHDYLKETLASTMMIDYSLDGLEIRNSEDLIDHLYKQAEKKYKDKENAVSSKIMTMIAKIGLVTKISENWQEHLREDEELRNGIGLLAHAQKDPLIAYKKSSFESFKNMLFKINQEALEFIYKTRIEMKIHNELEELKAREDKEISSLKIKDENSKNSRAKTVVNDRPKIKRNAQCPCGSGKKYKNCCGMNE